jgi:6-phosphogluconolactonase
MTAEINRYANLADLSQAAAELICGLAQACIRERCVFTLALSGGSTPRTLYELLAREPYANRIAWAHTHLFWGDERYVPAEHPDSNFAMAAQTLIERVPIPAQNVHRIPTDRPTPEAAADAYQETLRTLFEVLGSVTPDDYRPMFDVILLGVGPDGHTASLFPGSPVLEESTRWAAATPVPALNPPVRRITLTYPVLNAAQHVLFLAAGADKQPILQTIWDRPGAAWERYPAARVAPRGKLYWFVA